MKLTTIISHLTKEYEKAKDLSMIRKPFSFALYQTWKWCDEVEEESGYEIKTEKRFTK